MNRFSITLAAAALVAVAGSVSAQTAPLCYEDKIDLTTTNWSDSVSIPKFDPAMGTLTSVSILLWGEIDSAFKVESLDNAPAAVTAKSSGQITLLRPDNTQLVAVLPEQDEVFNASAFDGVIDFAGTSGKDFGVIIAQKSESVTSPPPASDLALFTGVGNIVLPVTATALSVGSGAGNLITQINTQAAASVRVCYNYEPVPGIPEPGTMALLGAGILPMVGLLRRRR